MRGSGTECVAGIKKAPLAVRWKGAVSDKCPVLTGHGRESEAGGGTVSKNEETPCLLGRGAREPQAASINLPWRRERNGVERVYKIAPLAVYSKRGVNPAATYSPGPVGQVPSAMRGLTSVFGKGTGMTPSR